MTLRSRRLAAAISIAFATSASAAMAADLRVGRYNEPQSIDPQYSRNGNDQMTAANIFNRLVEREPSGKAKPGLMESWANVDPLTWDLHIRKGVKWHDGTPLTRDDVLFSIDRATNMKNTMQQFTASTGTVVSIEAIGDSTIRVRTKNPDPLLPENIGTLYIVQKKAVGDAPSTAFRDPKVAVGTGPFKYVSYTPGDRLELVRNDDYWEGKSDFDKVTIRFISNDAARIAALLSNAVDLIDLVPPVDAANLKKNPAISIHATPTIRLVFLALTQNDKAPFVTDADGKPLDKNPLKDARVRKAISMMINRQALVDGILIGQGVPAMQIVPDGIFGNTPALKPTFDVAGARKLLTEAGYPNGFGLTIHGSSDRFLMDGPILQALGQSLARGGLKARVEALPYSVFATAAGRDTYGAFIFTYGAMTFESGRGLNSLFHTADRDSNMGALNRIRYSNKKVDEAINAANGIFDAAEREKAIQKVTENLFNEEMPIVPLYFQSIVWATRKGFAYTPRRDEFTQAYSASIAK